MALGGLGRRRHGGRAVAIVLALASAMVAPAGAVAVGDPTQAPAGARVATTTIDCGGATVVLSARLEGWDSSAPAGPPSTLTLTWPGRETFLVDSIDLGGRIELDRCRDVDGDGRPELVYTIHTGGNHCCTLLAILRPQAPAAELLFANLLDAGKARLTQLDDGPALEFLASDYRLAYMGVPFSETSPFPRVFAYRDGRYVDATREYPALLRASRDEALKRVATCGGYAFCEKGVGLRIVAIDLLLGAEPSGIARLPVSRPIRQWLVGMRASVAEALAYD
jgi:hypothetical protein